jgi:CDP-diacylglycerol---glycerol-3-phosphate 3-phosphatidyltransferase
MAAPGIPALARGQALDRANPPRGGQALGRVRKQPRGPAAGHNLPGVFTPNLPNVLTVLRIMLVPALVVALLGNTPAGDVLAAVVFALASLTDFVDGYLARARGSVTTFGKLMDPLADKLLIVAALISLVSLHRLAAWIAMVIITRELAVTVLRLGATQAGVVIGASLFGKVKTCLQIAAVLAVIAVHGQPPWVSVLLYATVLVTVLSGLDYFFGLRRRMQQAQAPGGGG